MWRWVRGHWIDLLAPPAALLLAAGIYRQVEWVRSGSRYAGWEAHYEAAASAGRKRERKTALAELAKAAEVAPDDAQIHVELATAYRAIGEPYKSAKHTEKAYRLAPPTHDECVRLVSSYFDLSKIEDAERVLREQLQTRWPDSADGHYYEGLIRLFRAEGNKDVASAVESFQECLKRNPQHHRAQYQLGQSLTRLGKLDEAEAVYRRLLKTAPYNTAVLHSLANVLRRKGNMKDLQPILDQVQSLGDLGEQVRHLEVQRGLNRATTEQLLELGEAYLALKQPAKAEIPIAEYTTKVPLDHHGHRRLAEVYRELNRPEFAESEEKLAAALEAASRTATSP